MQLSIERTPLRGRPFLSRRDRAILDRTRRILAGASADLGVAAGALEQATAELIPSGRIYLLGGGVIGSLVSGIGIVAHERRVVVARVDAAGRWTALETLLA